MEVHYRINYGKIQELDAKVQHLSIGFIPCINIKTELIQDFVRLTSLIQVRYFQSILRNIRVTPQNCCNQCTSTTSHVPLWYWIIWKIQNGFLFHVMIDDIVCVKNKDKNITQSVNTKQKQSTKHDKRFTYISAKMEITYLHHCFVMDPKTVQVEKMNKYVIAAKAILKSLTLPFAAKFALHPHALVQLYSTNYQQVDAENILRRNILIKYNIFPKIFWIKI